MVSKEEVVEKRNDLYKLSERKHVFNKGDRRVHTPRLCVVCGRPLSSLVVHENRYVTIQPHIRFHLNKVFIVDVCKDINSCYRNLKKKGELEDVNV